MNLPIRFSVIIPMYNSRATIERSITSALQQTLAPHEIIVVDDGSTDDSADLIAATFGKQIRLIRFSGNQGPSAARNAGIDAASGTHLAFLDADDYWLPQKLARMAEVLQAHPETLLLFHDRALHPAHFEPKLPETQMLWHFLVRNPAATPCSVVPKSEIRFLTGMHWMEDHDYFLRHVEKGPVLYLDEPLTLLGRPLLSEGGQSANSLGMRKGEWRVVKRFMSRNPLYYPLAPFWILFLFAKHLLGIRRNRRT